MISKKRYEKKSYVRCTLGCSIDGVLQWQEHRNQLQQDYIDRKDGHDEASGVLEVLDGNVLMLVRPSSGEHTFYKVKDNSSVIMTDSLGNEPEGETAKLYVLTKK